MNAPGGGTVVPVREEGPEMRRKQGKGIVDQALAAWRESGESAEHFSPAARDRILQAAFEGRPAPLATRLPFRGAPRRFAGGLLSLAAAAALLLAVVLVDRGGAPGGSGAVRVLASKTDGEVVFTIANGKRAHTVYKSNDPSEFGSSSRIPVRDGAFRDVVDDGSGLVFYRID